MKYYSWGKSTVVTAIAAVTLLSPSVSLSGTPGLG